MGARWVVGDMAKSASNFRAAAAGISGDARDELQAAGEQLQAEGQRIISSTGTNREWSREWYGRSGSGPGRINTGAMVGDYEFDIQSGSVINRLRVGWINNFEKYYGFQDKGFNHWVGVTVAGMELQSKMKGLVRSATNNVGIQIVNGLVRRLRGR